MCCFLLRRQYVPLLAERDLCQLAGKEMIFKDCKNGRQDDEGRGVTEDGMMKRAKEVIGRGKDQIDLM